MIPRPGSKSRSSRSQRPLVTSKTLPPGDVGVVGCVQENLDAGSNGAGGLHVEQECNESIRLTGLHQCQTLRLMQLLLKQMFDKRAMAPQRATATFDA